MTSGSEPVAAQITQDLIGLVGFLLTLKMFDLPEHEENFPIACRRLEQIAMRSSADVREMIYYYTHLRDVAQGIAVILSESKQGIAGRGSIPNRSSVRRDTN